MRKNPGMLKYLNQNIKLYSGLYTNDDSISNIMCTQDIPQGAKVMIIPYEQLLSYTFSAKRPSN